jgi:hypothetical protein
MVIVVQRKFKVLFLINSNRTLTQISNYVTNTIFPSWDTALTNAFTGYQFGVPTVILKKPRVFATTPTGRFWVYPKYAIQTQVNNANWDDARSNFVAFIDDVKNRTRDLILSLSAGTTVIEIWKRDFDGNMVVTTN